MKEPGASERVFGDPILSSPHMPVSDLDCEVVITRGGKSAIRDKNSGEVMHPVVGPLVEGEKLYIDAARLRERLSEPSTTPLVVLDIGLGAGTNAILAWRSSEALPLSARPLRIVSFDRSLAALELAARPEHAAAFGLNGEAQVAARALIAHGHHQTQRTEWRLALGDILQCLALEASRSADIVFWDPFSPRQNPELWTLRAFAAARRVCREGSTLHTYSRATATRSALLLAGFAVGIGPKTGDKPTTIAADNVAGLEHPLRPEWLGRLQRSSAPFPPDAPKDAFAQIRECPQWGTRANSRERDDATAVQTGIPDG